MTDEAYFHLNGFGNKQKFRYWGVEIPRILKEKELHPKLLTVWCTIMCDNIIGPYFFKNRDSQWRKISTHA